MNQFTRVAQNSRCIFLGNVNLGSAVSLKELRDLYHVVVLAYGAESDRVLGIPGEVSLGEGVLKCGCIKQFHSVTWH